MLTEMIANQMQCGCIDMISIDKNEIKRFAIVVDEPVLAGDDYLASVKLFSAEYWTEIMATCVSYDCYNNTAVFAITDMMGQKSGEYELVIRGDDMTTVIAHGMILQHNEEMSSGNNGIVIKQ